MTVREMIADANRELLSGEVSPERARHLLNRLSALLSNTINEIREADAEFAVVYLHCLETCEAANRAKIQAECTPEYKRKREAQDTKKIAELLISSLKYQIKSLSDEMRLGGGSH